MVKRYSWSMEDHGMREQPSQWAGGWVQATDYAALDARCRELEALTKEASRDIDLPAEWHDKFRELFRNSPAETETERMAAALDIDLPTPKIEGKQS